MEILLQHRIGCWRQDVFGVCCLGNQRDIAPGLDLRQKAGGILFKSQDSGIRSIIPVSYTHLLGDHGHLSNENAGRLLNYILHDNLKNILLGHLSKENNYEELAYETVKLEIEQGDHEYHSADFSIAVAKRDFMSDIITI